MFVKKEKFQPRWDSNPKTLHKKSNTLPACQRGLLVFQAGEFLRYLYFSTTLVEHSVLFFSLLNFIHQKAWFEMFSRFIRSQTYIIFVFLHIKNAIHCNFRNWHQLFYKRSISCKIHALPLSNVFLVYRFCGDIDYLENHI